MAASIPNDDLRASDQGMFWEMAGGVFIIGCIAWPTAAVLAVLYAFDVVTWRAPAVAACVPFAPPAMFLCVGLPLLGLVVGIQNAARLVAQAYRSDIVRTRRVRRRVRHSHRPGDLLTYWHRAHQAALETGCEPPEAVRRADAAVLRP